MRLTMMAVCLAAILAAFLAAFTSPGHAQSPVNQPPAKKQSIRQICTERVDALGLRGTSVRNKYWWHCWRRHGR
jgi:hypothetical protein